MLQAVAEACCLQRIIIVPAGCTPNKGLIGDSSAVSRWKLLTEAAKDTGTVLCCSLEINTSDCSYTADTIETIHNKFPEDELLLLIGEDLYDFFDNWYRSDLIRRTAKLIVVRRGSVDSAEVSRNADDIFLGPVSGFSSTEFRQACSSAKRISDYCPVSCEYALYADGLYVDPQLSAEIGFIKKHQKSTRFRHTIGVARSALDLAERLGVQNTRPVLRSALLHDIAKELPYQKAKELASVFPDDLGSTDILPVIHAPAGAALARRLFSVSDEEYHAIKLHCTLDSDMVLLDKIIYISDMVEPSRNFPAVFKLRECFSSVRTENDLDRLLILALEQNICYISNTGGVVHPASLRALSFLKNGNR